MRIGRTLDVFGGAFRTLRASGIRGGLTSLGIAIAVLSVAMVTALSQGAQAKIGAQIESLGSNVVIIFPESPQASGARLADLGARLTDEDVQSLATDAPSIRHVAPALRARARAQSATSNVSTSIIGTTRNYLLVRNWDLKTGTTWDDAAEQGGTRVCLLGETVRRKLFESGDPIGQTIKIGPHVYQVLGTLASKGQAAIGGDQDDVILMPLRTARGRLVKAPRGTAGVLFMSAKSGESVSRAVTQATEILRERHHIAPGNRPDFSVRTQKEFQDMQKAIYGFLAILLLGAATVSLVVGGVGVMNIMLVTVTERTKEIGLRMALGATPRDIRVQFLTESAALCLFGGSAGLALSVAITLGLRAALDWPLALSPQAIAVALLVSLGAGVLFGLAPASRAAKLDPTIALGR